MKRFWIASWIASCLFACAAGTAAAADVPAEIMPQPDAPIKVDGCSAESRPMNNGTNVVERTSFEAVGKTATAVKIGFAFFDALGGRSIHSGVKTGSFSPGARIDVAPYAGRIGSGTTKLVCFAYEAAFSDGTRWTASVLPTAETQPAAAVPGAAAGVPAHILPQEASRVRFDRCAVAAPQGGTVAVDLALTNLTEQTIRSIDVDFVFYDTARNRTFAHTVLRGEYAPNATVAATPNLKSAVTAYAKAYCTVGIIEFADGRKWSAGAGFLTGATPP
jgi:hypothetical protein